MIIIGQDNSTLEGGQSTIMVKLYLDPGHGGTDPGANGNDIKEKDINLILAKKIKAKLLANYKNIEIKMSRDKDVFVSLDARTKEANNWNADAFLSIHINASSVPTAKGYASYIYTNTNAQTKAFQNVMHGEILRALNGVIGVEDDGKKQANFHVLRESKMTALLTENFFISNPSDAEKLKSDAILDKIANGHVMGLAKFFGLQDAAKPISSPSTKFYQVVAGSFTDRENAEEQVKMLKADGYDSFIEVKD
jgi:N-acetylmuramoyl-L-alanine amidase